MATWLLIVVLFAAVLAGCMERPDPSPEDQTDRGVGGDGIGDGGSGTGSTRSPDSSSSGSGQNDRSSQGGGTGEVRGFVANADYEPLKEAQVTILDPEENREVQSLQTGENGGFLFEDVPVGEYRIHAAQSCCREHVERIVVEADETTQVDVVLPYFTEDELEKPYVEEFVWEGFVACDVRIWWFTGLMGPSDHCLDSNHEFGENFTVHEGIRTIVVALEWDPVLTSVPGDMELRIKRGLSDNPFAQGFDYARIDGDSPLEVRIDAGQYNGTADEQFDLENIDGEMGISLWVFGGSDESFGVTYQQPVTIHYELHYWAHAPDGHSALPQ